ncbi:MAG: glycoside hydrolase family 16 protein, partial [Acutalibacteraceae bacterium]|nr:glycoside hydrolase family 16 protein [Acutalibacteraceae bacterium]
MKKTLSILLTLALLISTFAIATTFNALAEDGWELVWNDEFSGSSVDTTRWDVFNTSKMAPRAGYTEFQEDNAIVKDGKLIIQNEIGGCEAGSSARYTSARLMTMDMFKYGKFEIRAKCAEATGTNSAFWTWGFPNNPNYEFHYFTKGKGSEPFDWRYGEIDVIERFNYPSWGSSRYRTVYSQLHFIGPYKKGDVVYTDKSEWGKTTYDTVKPGDVASWLDPGVDYGNTWHNFGFEWNADEIKLFRDGVQYGTLDLRYTSDTYPTAADAMDVFREYCQKIILSDWLGGDTVSGNSTFQIDYLRIWQKPGCYINYNEYGTSAYNAAKKVQTMDTKLATHNGYYYQPELKGDASYTIFDADASSVTYPSLPQNASADSIATHGTRKALRIKRGTQYDNVCVEFPGDYSTVAKNAKYLRTWVAAEDGAMYYADQKGGISYGFRTTDGKYYFANGEKGLNYCASNIAYSGNYYWVDLSNLMLTETGVHKYTATDGRVFGDRLMDVKSGQTTPFSSIAGKIDAVYVNFGVISGMGTATGVNKCYFIDNLEFVNDAIVPPTSATTQPTAVTTATPTATPTAATTAPQPTQSTTSSSGST